MGVYNAGTTNIGLFSDIKLNSASATSIESGTNISTKELLENHYAPPTSGQDNFAHIYNKSYRVLALRASRCTVQINYPTAYNAWKWKPGDAGNGTSSTVINHTDSVTNGRSLYLRGIDYSTYPYVSLQINPDYGYSISSYAWYNSAGTLLFSVSTTSGNYTLYSNTDTDGGRFFMRWFAT